MGKNILKAVFDWFREVLEAADVPFVLLVLVVLPFVVPFVPAWVTAKNLREIMLFPPEISFVGGLTIELLGFSGAILFLRSIMEWMRDKRSTDALAIWLTGLSYLFYLVAVIVINVILDIQAERDWSYIWVIACLCLLSVPSGLLSASRINRRELDAKDEKVRQEKRSDRMTRWLTRHGFQISGGSGKSDERVYNSNIKRAGSGYASDHKKAVLALLEKEHRKSGKVLGASYICKRLRLDPKTQRAEVWKQVQEWKRGKGL